jgi:adenylate kinase family enzyme
MNKILVIGSGGAGKSTFSRKLGELLRIPVIHLDSIYWKPNWEETPPAEWTEIVQKLLNRDSWIMDGNYSRTRGMRLQACDTVIWLDTPRRICLYRVVKRALIHRNKVRPDMAAGCTERLNWEFIKWVWRYPERSGKRLEAELDNVSDRKIVILRSAREADNFLKKLTSQ